MSDPPPSCSIYLNKLKQKINGHLDEYSDETEIDQAVHQLRMSQVVGNGPHTLCFQALL